MKKSLVITIILLSIPYQKAEASFFSDFFCRNFSYCSDSPIDTAPTILSTTEPSSPYTNMLMFVNRQDYDPPTIPKSNNDSEDSITESNPRNIVEEIKSSPDMTKAVQKYLGTSADGIWGNKTESMFKKLSEKLKLSSEDTLQKIDAELDLKQNGNNEIPIIGSGTKLGQGKATFFGHLPLPDTCDIDSDDISLSASGISLNTPGKAIPAVASWKGNKGDAVYIINTDNNICKIFPLLERGPGKGPMSDGVVIDLTGSAYQIMKGQMPCTKISNKVGQSSNQKYDKKGHINVIYGILKDVKIKAGEVKDCNY